MKPILFNTGMTKAILEDRKSVTRRVIKPQPILDKGFWQLNGAGWSDTIKSFRPVPCHSLYNMMPYKINDILYVRETCMIQSMKNFEKKVKMLFKADDSLQEFKVSDEEYERLSKWGLFTKWLSPYWTTKETARTFLRITDIRIERLQDITEEQATKEGFNRVAELFTARELFQAEWNHITKKQDSKIYSWDVNPWVWVVEFERCEKLSH